MTNLPFPTTQEQIAKLPAFLDEMLLADLAPDFVEKVIELAAECQGMFELVEMWSEHRNEARERELDLLSIYDLMKDCEL